MNLPPTPMIVEALQQIVGPPLILGVVLLLVARFVMRNHAPHLAAVLAVIGSLALGNWLANINPDWWPTDKRVTWLPWLAAAGCLAGLCLRPFHASILGHPIWAVVMVYCVLHIVPKEYLASPKWALPAFILLTAILGFGYLKLNEVQPGFVVPGLFAAGLWTAGLVIIHAHSKSLMDVAMLGAMALLGLAMLAFFTKADVGACYPGAVFLLTGSLFAGYHETYSKVPVQGFLLPALAPLLGLVGLLPWVQRRPRAWRILIVAVPTLVVLGMAVSITMSNETLEFEAEEY